MTRFNSAFSARLLKCTRLGVLSASVFLAASAAHAQVPITIYGTDFNTDAYTTASGAPSPSTYGGFGSVDVASTSLSGSPNTVPGTDTNNPLLDTTTQWQTNDNSVVAPYNVGQSDFVGTLGGYGSAVPDDQVAFLGGLYGTAIRPGAAVVYDYRAVSTSATLGLINTAGLTPILGLSVDMAISHSTSPRTRSDVFGFSFQNSSGQDLFSIRFTPNALTGATKYNVALFDASGTKVGANQLAVNTDAFYHLNIGAISNNGEVTLSLQSENNDESLIGGTEAHATAFDADINLASLQAVERISPTWILQDGATTAANGGKTNAGTNSLIFDNYTITGVPEPSTWMMLGLGAMGLFWRLRRKAQV